MLLSDIQNKIPNIHLSAYFCFNDANIIKILYYYPLTLFYILSKVVGPLYIIPQLYAKRMVDIT